MKKTLLLFLALAFCLPLAAENFVVNAYDILIDVNEDSSIHVKERILCAFHLPSHGIYRDIQYRFPNPDGNFADPVRAEVYNFVSNTPFNEEKEDGCYRFYLGDEDTLVSGEQEYTIEYDYSLGRDLYKEYDEFYYNIISPDWDTPIWNITYTITFPKKIDESRIWVTLGDEGSAVLSQFSLSGDGRTISGSRAGLRNNGGLTIRVEMDEGYWTGLEEKKDNSTVYLYISIIITLLLFVLTLVLWYLFGRDPKYDKAVLETPPEALSPMEFRFILEDGEEKPERDLGAMLMYWAGKGIIRITPREEKKNPDYTIEKLSDLPPDSSEMEKALFSIVFKKTDVTFDSIAESRYRDEYYSRVKKEYTKKYGTGDKALKSRTGSILEGILLSAFLIVSVLDGILISMKFPGILDILFSLLLVVLFFSSAVTGSMYQRRGQEWGKKKRTVVPAICGLVWAGITFLLILLSIKTFLNMPHVLIAVVIDTLAVAIGTFTASLTEKRTEYGRDIYEKCLGFRRYILEYSEPDGEKLGSLMPYAAALNMCSSLSKRFRNISVPKPAWYCGSYNDSPWMIYVFLNNSFSRSYTSGMNNHASSSPSSTGFSGGGFSGGGGGSW